MHVQIRKNSHEKKKHLGSLLFIPCLFCEYCHESVLKAHFSRRDFYCYSLNSDDFCKERAGYNVSALLKRSSSFMFLAL